MTRRNGRQGTKYNRRGSVSGMGMSSNPMREKMVRNMRNMLESMKYTLSSNAVLVFQRDFNIVRNFHPEIGPPITENGTYNSETYTAMKNAIAFDESLPKAWIFYVKKYRSIAGVGGRPRSRSRLKRPSKVSSRRGRRKAAAHRRRRR